MVPSREVYVTYNDMEGTRVSVVVEVVGTDRVLVEGDMMHDLSHPISG